VYFGKTNIAAAFLTIHCICVCVCAYL